MFNLCILIEFNSCRDFNSAKSWLLDKFVSATKTAESRKSSPEVRLFIGNCSRFNFVNSTEFVSITHQNSRQRVRSQFRSLNDVGFTGERDSSEIILTKYQILLKFELLDYILDFSVHFHTSGDSCLSTRRDTERIRRDRQRYVTLKSRNNNDAFLLDPSELSFSVEKLQNLELVKRCLMESIRLRSPGAISRGVEKSFKIKNYTIPEGDLLMLSPYWVHRNPKYFQDPDSFKPVRTFDLR
jgi:hypothetical protein